MVGDVREVPSGSASFDCKLEDGCGETILISSFVGVSGAATI